MDNQGLKASSDIWVFAEQKNKRLAGVVYELLAPGRRLSDKLGGSLASVLIGYDVSDLAEELLACGVDVVYKVDAPPLAHYNSWLYPRILEKLVKENPPNSLLIGATYAGMSLAPALAARLGVGCSAHCVNLDVDDHGNLLQYVPGFGGSLMAIIISPYSRPQIATIKQGVFTKTESKPGIKKGMIREVAFEFTGPIPVKVLEIKQEKHAGMPLEKAKVVVAGGAGVGSKEGWAKIEELAALMGGAVGATRPAVDEGWAKESQMIGQSGKTVRPELYIGVGISGDIQHTVGIQDAQKIVAINNNPKAPIFKMADYGIVGDYKEIVPLLIEAIAQEKN
ncbi:electron transfer flavoprotein subunit alpha/FixB family protein [Desulfofundulus thermosubterraneus]|uniref:Electron transfer flavoprotein alpha subunit apoprotein n=1 Tax=Desulfofundulus thermosubterraneus DSM 16057 TaxID=1121432 RepID=A0A1M6GR49_9FIRM|nr:electron transfer flavoprotein subunit alpha/FixB family protein [Desulfofundulus thermosubterraneus]SHJ12393.1 electron transfer flavoprotein alpha subunit apoprotein [Desulfofundulus thermosubterraneus DSM 16057]